MMKVFLLKDVPKVGVAGEVIKVADGYGQNFLVPRKLGVEITAANENFYKKQEKTVEHRKEVIASKTSMLAEKIGGMKLTLKRKMHDDGKLYGAVASSEIVDALSEKGIGISKSQVEFNKSIKAKGAHEVVIRLSSTLKPAITVTIVPE
ncbi:MAG: 50S ribosomal protein L9 [Candidatus Babeliales bacterium]|nr:50S ribosomal protein L9 [Candidatus Babeliales bacterium]